MVDIPTNIENVQFMWGCAFILDIVIGLFMFSTIMRQNLPPWARGACGWIGWWAWASAFTLIINLVAGTDNPFAYHQIGVFTESMTNLGVLWWMVMLTMKNWYLKGKDFKKIEELRNDLFCQNMKRETIRAYEDDPK